MSQNHIRLSSFIIFLNFSFIAVGQNEWKQQRKFLHHLDSLKLFEEKIYWLKSNDERFPPDSGLKETAKTYMVIKNYDQAALFYEKMQTIPVNERGCYAGALLASSNFDKLEVFVKDTTFFLKEEKKLFYNYLWIKEYKQKDVSIDSVFGPTSGIGIFYKKYKKAQPKSPFLAAVFSAVIPGLGKGYYGKWGDAVPSFIISTIFVAQAAESFVKAGTHNAGFWIFSGLFGIFYFGNITGSYLGLKKYKKELQQQLHYEILQHHMATYPYCWK